MPTEGGAAAHAGLAVLGLPLPCPLYGMLPGVWQGSLELAALLCGAHTRAHGASRWQGVPATGVTASRAAVPGCILLAGAPPACTLLVELHGVFKGSPELAALLCGA